MDCKRFLYIWIGWLVLLLIPIGVVLKYLSLLYEHNTYREIVERQMQKNSLYGSALNENYFSYRLEMIRAKKPEIVILGTSRAGLFREKFFNTTIVAATNGANTLNELDLFVEKMLELHQPKIAIINLDPWWLIDKSPNYSKASYQDLTGRDITSEKIKNIIAFFWNKKIPLSLEFLNNGFLSNPYTVYDSLGLRAIEKSDGSLSDGSTLYGSLIYGLGEFQDERFENTLMRIENQIAPFYYAQKLEQDRLDKLIEIKKKLEQKNIYTIIYISPIAPTVYSNIKEKYFSEFSYLELLQPMADKYGIFNFFNPSSLFATNCEFYDGFHAGDIVYAKMLLNIAQRDKIVSSVVDRDFLTMLIATRGDHAFALEHKKGMREIDFLRIGCRK